MNPEAQELLNKILAKEPEELNANEISFLRARQSYLKKSQLEEYDSVLNPKETKPAKKQTVKKMAKPTPNKPTEEELKAKEEEAIKAAEELEGRQQIPQDNPEEEVEVEDEIPEVDTTPEEEGEKEEEPVTEVEEEAEPSKELYKKKFSASSRENQRINAKNRVINQALVNAEDVSEPTEEELTHEFPDWDLMSDVEKHLARETVITRKWRQVISQAKEQATKIEKWNDSVNEFIDDPKTLNENPDLEGKEDEFREFATEESNNSVPFNILVSAFLHNHQATKPINKGRMFERGKGGSNEKPLPKSDKLSLEESRKLRETDYNLWRKKLAEGKIDTAI